MLIRHIAACAAAMSVLAASAVTPREMIGRIHSGPYNAPASFSVTMPQLPDDVVYALEITQSPAVNDTILPVSYLIDWAITQRPGMDRPSPADKGFNAYFDGNFFSLMAERLREQHASDSPAAFMSPRRGGVAVTAQFADLVPALIAAKLSDMLDDPRYTVTAVADTVVDGSRAVAILTRLSSGGTVASEGEYIFYPGETLSPRRITLENNIGAISEQTISARFDPPAEGVDVEPVTEEALMERYPDEFAAFRTSTYRLETLPGRHLPAMAAPAIDGTRFTRTASQMLPAPAALVFLDADSDFTPEVIRQVREAAAMLPYRFDIIWAFVNTNPEAVAPLTATGAGPYETTVTSARSVAADCGAASTIPAVVFAAKDGIVTDFIAGVNKTFASDVIKKMTAIRP